MSETDPYAAPNSEPNVYEAEQAAAEAPASQVPTGSVKDVIEWVGDDKERAKLALDAEKAGDNRKGVLNHVNGLLD